MICQGRLVGSLLVMIVFLSACGATHAGWNSFPVPIYADSSVISSQEAQADLKDAFNFWESQTGKQIFDFKGEWVSKTLPYTGNPTSPDAILGNVIFFQNPWPYTPTTVGMTTVISSDQGIESAMIMLNPNTLFCSGDCHFDYRTSRRKTFAHELGHFIGLSHVNDPDNIMYPTSIPGGSLSQVKVDSTTLKTLVSP
jgi:hypothetical protein